MNDGDALEQFLREVSSTIDEMGNGALQRGRSLRELAFVFERRIDGSFHGGCVSRRELAEKIRVDSRFAPEQRDVLAKGLDAPGDDVPVLLRIDRGEGEMTIGLRRVGGSFVTLS